MEDEAKSKQKTLAIMLHHSGDNVFVRAIQDIEILAPCATDHATNHATDHATNDRIYNRTCGNYFLKANDEVVLPVPPNATPHMHVRLTPHSGTLEELSRESDWTRVNLIKTHGKHHTSGPMSEPTQP